MSEVATEVLAVELTVNGRQIEGQVEPRISLADFLREELQLTGTALSVRFGPPPALGFPNYSAEFNNQTCF